MQIDEWLPEYDFSAAHQILIRRPVDATHDALLRADFSRPLIVRGLMGLRALPTRFLLRPATAASSPSPSEPTATRRLLGLGFTVLDDVRPHELVLGLQGQFWRLCPRLHRVAVEAFRRPVPTGEARAVWNFSLTEHEGGTDLRTETRIACGDSATRRRFGFYWTLIGPFSGLIRKAILAEVRREAEKPAV